MVRLVIFINLNIFEPNNGDMPELNTIFVSRTTLFFVPYKSGTYFEDFMQSLSTGIYQYNLVYLSSYFDWSGGKKSFVVEIDHNFYTDHNIDPVSRPILCI